MSDFEHRVTIVFGAPAYEDLVCWSLKSHVWLAQSPENQALAERLWAEFPGDYSVTSGLTTFAVADELPLAALAMVLECVEDHHGEWGNPVPLSTLRVVGVTPSPAVRDLLTEWSYFEVRPSPNGLTARRQESRRD